MKFVLNVGLINKGNMKTIYKITNVFNAKVYVGCCSDFSKRKYAHRMHALNGTYKEGSKLYPDMIKWGIKSFNFSIIEKVPNSLACQREAYWISFLCSYMNGYNTTPHGLCGPGFWTGKKRPDLSAQKKGRMVLIQNAINASKKRIVCIDTGEVFESATFASFKIGRTYSAVAYAARHGSKCAGLRWSYV